MAGSSPSQLIAAVIFDLDGVLVDSEQVWDEVSERLTAEAGGTWHERATPDMMGMSAPEWSAYMHEELGVPLDREEISGRVVEAVEARYRPEIAAHRRRRRGGAAARRPLASGAGLIRESTDHRPGARLDGLVGLVCCQCVSSEEVERGKPAPDVYLEAAGRLGGRAGSLCRDRGLLQRPALGGRRRLCVIAVPNRSFPPEEDALALACQTVAGLDALAPELIERCG